MMKTKNQNLLTKVKHWFMGSPSHGTPFDQVPQSFAPSWWQRNQSFGHDDKCPAVSACVDAYAQTIATLEVEHCRYTDTGGKKPIRNSPLARVLRHPNHYQTRSDLLMNAVRDLLYHGNAYIYGQRNTYGDIEEIFLVPSGRCRPFIEPDSREIWYGTGANPLETKEIEAWIPSRDVMHLRLHTPYNDLIGVSPIENAALAIAANRSMAAHQAVFFSNMARPSGFVSVDTELMTEVQIKQARAAFNNQAQQMNSGGIPFLPSSMKYQQLSLSSTDAELIEAFKLTVSEIASAFRVPLPIIGSYEHATFNNVENLQGFWLSTGLGFLLNHIEQALDKFFGLPDDEFTIFDTDTLMRTDFQARMTALSTGVTHGIYSPNEARSKEGLPAVEFGDEPRVQAQSVPLSQVEMSQSADPSPTPPVPPVSEEEEKAIAYHLIKKAMTA
jgi:HK97 family phage portal protein